MEKKVQKYFMAGTDDELQFGDVIELDFVGEEDGVKKHTHLEVKFQPELVGELLKEGVIETDVEEEENDELIDFDEEEEDDTFEFQKCIAQDIDEIRDILKAHLERISTLEEESEAQARMVNKMMSDLKKCINDVKEAINVNTKKTASSRKKK